MLILINQASAQDNCSAAVALCANNLITRTTVGATTVGTDPALSCGDNTVNNSVWFTVVAFNNGNCTITVSNINNTPGLEMQVYTGSCGVLSALGPCASGDAGTGGTMSMNFATTAGTTYYIMVDGTLGNQEAFDILATTSNDAIVARPDANFNTNPSSGCRPLAVQLQNTTVLHGGTNISYEWRFNAGPYIPSSGLDTNIVLSTTGTHSVTLRVCNTQCGCKTVTQDIIVQDLFPTISYSPIASCIGTDLTFTGDATILPDPPLVDPAITSWDWNFGDPSSGINNTANGQIVNHTFNGPASSFTVTLVTQGTCGPDTTQTVINLRPRPTVDAGGLAQTICEGTPVTLNATTTNLTNPIIYSWTGPGTISCDTCQSTDIDGLPAGGPHIVTISVVDSFACTADTTIDITVNPKPVVNAGPNVQVCEYGSVMLNATPTVGNPPFGYTWSPSTGLDSDAIQNPVATVTGPITYCVTITDSIGCMSDPDCLDISLFPKPTINAATPILCASEPVLQNTFTVSGAGAGSTYEWLLSPDYSLITSSNIDSSAVIVTFPTGVASTYTFISIITDGITGCRDTVFTAFTINTGLTLAVSGSNNVCRGDMLNLTASGATNYTWTANPAYSFSDPSLATQSVSPLVSTIFTVTGTTGTCTGVATHTVTVNAKPLANIQAIPPVCGCTAVDLDGTGSTSGMLYHWSSVSGNLITDTAALVTTAQACINDVFILFVLDPLNGCFKDTSVAVISRLKPDATAYVQPDLICDGTNTVVTLDGTGSNTDPGTTYLWSSNNLGALIADSSSLATLADLNTSTVFYLTVTDSQGCDSIATDTVQIYPTPAFLASNPFLCTSDPSLQSTLEIIGASFGSVYNWTSIAACLVPNTTNLESQTFDFSACGTGSFVFNVTVTDAITSCVNDLTTTVVVVSGVNLVVSNDTVLCEGGDVTLTATGANNYLWSTTDTSSTLVLSGLSAAGSPYTYYISGTIGGCSADDSVLVTINPIPVTSPINGPATVCVGDTGIYYDVTPLTGNYSWLIQGGTITTGQGSSIISVNWDSAGTFLLSVVDTNSFGCPGNTENISVTVNAIPDSSTNIIGPLTVCENSTETYFVVSNAGSQYTWSVTGGTIVGTNISDIIDVIWGSSGTGDISVFEINSNACSGPVITQNVTINARPTIPIVTGDISACDSSRAFYSTNFNAGSVYSWDISGGSIINTSTNADSIEVIWTMTGGGFVSVAETNSDGCASDTSLYSVTVNAKPQASALPDSATLCQNTTLSITGTATGSAIQWISSGTGTFSDPAISSPIYSAGSADTGFVSLRMIVSSAPCENDTAEVVVYISPSPVVSITGTSNTICFADNDTLVAQGGGTYLWAPGGSTNSTIVVSPPVTTTYYLTVTNSFACSTDDSVLVTVNPPGIPDAGNDQLICRGDTAGFSGTQAGGGGYNWTTLGDGSFLPHTSDQQVLYIPGIQDTANGIVNIVLTTTGYCLNLKDTLTLQVNDLPSIDAGPDTTITSGPGTGVSIVLTPSILNGTGIFWTSNGTGTFTPNDTTFNAQYVPSDADFYLDSVIITATSTGSCRPVSDILVIEFTPFKIPNVFTPYPNSPGFNDYFEIPNLPRNSGLKIWNRWGLVVFATDDYLNNWEAAGQPAEIYYYVLSTSRKEYKGWLQLIRD